MASCWVPAKLPSQNKIRIPNNTQKEEEYEKQRKQAVQKRDLLALKKYICTIYAHKKEGSKEEKDLEHELDTEIINL
jgi:hypothetical protein